FDPLHLVTGISKHMMVRRRAWKAICSKPVGIPKEKELLLGAEIERSWCGMPALVNYCTSFPATKGLSTMYDSLQVQSQLVRILKFHASLSCAKKELQTVLTFCSRLLLDRSKSTARRARKVATFLRGMKIL